MGALIAAGHDPEDMMNRYSWEQLGLFAECLSLHHSGLMEAVLAPLAASMGAGWRSGGNASQGPSRATEVDHSDPDSVERAKRRDAAILAHGSRIKGVSFDL